MSLSKLISNKEGTQFHAQKFQIVYRFIAKLRAKSPFHTVSCMWWLRSKADSVREKGTLQ